MPSAQFARLYAFALAIDFGLEFVSSSTSTPATGVKVLVAKTLFSQSNAEVTKAPRLTKAPRPTPITGPTSYEYLSGGYDLDVYTLFCLLDWQTKSYSLKKS
ncbi:hypothetical protein DFP72DRAFT_853667 [Ephemerocybe angulata]|uniref:Uncharacterized protein n=1 Tax=Ephemerocybe angulata TaxID=980116 RepID=A0A8H6HKR2_9AGAR|nr:hypothetical protein DFP72DRAFT_853667 [Tulosesus angulatus]